MLARRAKTERSRLVSWGRRPRMVTRDLTVARTSARRTLTRSRTRSTSPSATGIPAASVRLLTTLERSSLRPWIWSRSSSSAAASEMSPLSALETVASKEVESV